MKRIVVFGCLLIVGLVCAIVAFGGGSLVGVGMLMAAPPVVLDTQQIVFMRSLQEEYVNIDT